MKSTVGSDAADTSPLRVVIGPTAAGKSAVAMRLAMRRNLSIVSADSRQIYRGFDIGTAKPSAADREAVPHFGVDVVSPEQRFSAHAWASDAATWIIESRKLHREPVIVGGTGFYIRALAHPIDEVPELDPARRKAFEPLLAALDRETLERWCRRLDPARAHLGRTQLVRAIETVLISGRRLSDTFTSGSPSRNVRYLVVDPGAALAERIERRIADMIERGWVDEVRELMSLVSPEAPAWRASGYEALREHVEGRVSLAAASQRVVIETKQYAKRQRTWCRHQLSDGHVTRIDPDAPEVDELVDEWWDHNGASR